MFGSLLTGSTTLISKDGSKYGGSVGGASGVVFDQLEVRTLSNADAGSYYCQVRFPGNGSFAVPSQQLALFTPEVFGGRFPPCSGFSPNFVREELCAPALLATPPPPATSVTPQDGGGDGGNGAGEGRGSGGSGPTTDPALVWGLVTGAAIFMLAAIVLSGLACYCSLSMLTKDRSNDDFVQRRNPKSEAPIGKSQL